MSSVPEIINHYLSKIFGIRLITKTDFDFFYNTLKTAVEDLEKLHLQSNFKYFPKNDEMSARVKDILTLLQPKHAKNVKKIRLGNPNDGGYVCLDSFSAIKSAVSLGINDDVSWDLDIANRGINVFQYDYSIEKTPIDHQNFKFFSLKVGGEDGAESITLNSIMRSNNIAAPGSVFLKMDIEGSEWEAFSSAEEEVMNSYSQIVCELHDLDQIENEEYFNKIIEVLRKLKQKFEVVHIHGNNHTPLMICPGLCTLPQTLEVSFANKNHFTFEEVEEDYPSPLDAPCNPKKADYFIDFVS